MSRGAIAAAAAVVIVAALTGCAGQSDPTSSKPQVSVPAETSGAATSDAGQPKITGPGQVSASASAQPSAPADAEDPITAAQEGAATGAASGFVSAYIDKTVTGDAWVKGWMPYLTTQAQAAYEGTSQQAVPGTTLTGTVKLEDGGTNGAAIVDVPTDAGTYTVQLNQVNGSWKVLRALLPGEDG
ncbi:hypothetical protein [Curtobacterium flaccumfaciens]|uniref:hypothetical protein n=1 Tax=Curtobacterium flaccumfaciens TaxID=2035 RepID=UPI001E562361|nr:hypothetical protein [Curtobacterium allii]MCE0459431.1 hypothetical protein [Curtobacterium allii]